MFVALVLLLLAAVGGGYAWSHWAVQIKADEAKLDAAIKADEAKVEADVQAAEKKL